MPSILNIGVSALTSYRQQLATTGHNISNVNTEGFSRQRNEFNARQPQGGGSGFIGTGVEVAATTRQYDEFLVNRLRTFTSSQQEFTAFYSQAIQVDDVILDPDAGINKSLQNFFNSVQDVADDPTSIPAREVMLSQANILSDRFESLDGWIEDMRGQTDANLDDIVSDLNGFASSIAKINNSIVDALGSFSQQPPNDLLDERDLLIKQMSELVSVTAIEQNDGSMNVFIGSGQAMVVGSNASTLQVTTNSEAPDRSEISLLQIGGFSLTVTDQLSGGQIGGMLNFREQVLDPAQNSIGRVAIGVAEFFNQEHITGMNLDGDLGGTFFSQSAPQVFSNNGNTGTIAVDYNNISNLTNYEYEMRYNGVSWNLTRADTGATVPMTGAGTALNPFVAEGISIVTDGLEVANDRYRIRPTRNGAKDVDVIISSPRDIAAADAVITSAGIAGAPNTGTGDIGPGAWVSTAVTPTKLATPITLTFNSGTNQFTDGVNFYNYNPATDSGNTISVNTSLGVFEFTMKGTPDNNDRFQLTDNTGGEGDNRNALRLADLQARKTLIGGSASFGETYNTLVADVGTLTRQASSNRIVQQNLLNQAENAQQAVSGVNLDEEAANLIRFQQAYQAAAQVVSIAGTLFDSLLGAIN